MKDFITAKAPSETMSAEELAALMAQATQQEQEKRAKQKQEQQAAAAAKAAAAAEAATGDAAAAAATSAPAAGEDTAMDASIDEAPIAISDDLLRAAWLAVREQQYTATKADLAARKQYEDVIKRPYFHVKPLDGSQLSTWAKYLTYAEGKYEPAAVKPLYERCLVACACYPGEGP